MNRTFITIIFIVECIVMVAQDKMKFGSLKLCDELDGFNISHKEFKKMKDVDAHEAAVIRVVIKGMSVDEMKELQIKGPQSGFNTPKFFYEERGEVCVPVAAKRDYEIWFMHPKYGESERLKVSKLKAKNIYITTLENIRTTSIRITCKPDGGRVYIDGKDTKQTASPSCEIQNQRMGKHTISVSFQGQSKVLEVDVQPGNTSFDFDFRKSKSIEIKSDPSDALISIMKDGEWVQIGKSPMTYEVLLGSQTFKAEAGYGRMDVMSVVIDEGTKEVKLNPIQKSNVVITTTYVGQPASQSTLMIDNQPARRDSSEYHFTLSYGKHSFTATLYGKTKTKTVKLNKPSWHHEFKFSAKNDFVWPWEREYEHRPIGISVGWVSKQVVGKAGSERLKCEPAYLRENRRLHGMQFMVHGQPCFSWGGGLYTGLAYEVYFAIDNSFYYSNFVEHVLNIPVHIYYRLPFSRKIALALHTGIGMDIGILGKYSSDSNSSGYSDSITDYYGDSGCPQRFNLTWDFAASMNFGLIGINFVYSRGLSNHPHILTGADKTEMNKLALSVSFLIGGGN